MCIIITKEKNAKPLPEEIFEIIWNNNPDGAGILYHNGKKAILKKGMMKKEEFLNATKAVNKTGISYIMHTRIATHGSVKPENTHPFVSKYLGFAHNGTFNVEPFPDKTDSETFFVGAIGNKKYKWCEENKFLLDLATNGCRCAIMDLESGKIMHLCEEDWKTDIKYKGYKFSNGGYQWATRFVYDKKNGTSCASTYDRYSRYDWDDYLEYWDPEDKYGVYNKLPAKKDEDDESVLKKINYDIFEKKHRMLTIKHDWIDPFLESYVELNDDIKKDHMMNQTLSQMGIEFAELKKQDGKESYEALAAGVIVNFTAYAKSKGYNNVQQIMDALKELLTTLNPETEEEKLLKEEISWQADTWR